VDPPDAVAVPVQAGSVVVFSSLTPHATGYNATDETRKAYFLQYAPDGAVALQGDPADGSPTARVPQEDPRRQFPVLVAGQLPPRH
jgi:ectoine hydroxylase-related dioxygenase (phytanoyl-CoA dioxygenase family)